MPQGFDLLSINLLIRIIKFSRKIRKILVTAMLANGMSELSSKIFKRKPSGVYPLTGGITDLHTQTAHSHQAFPLQLRQVFLIRQHRKLLSELGVTLAAI